MGSNGFEFKIKINVRGTGLIRELFDTTLKIIDIITAESAHSNIEVEIIDWKLIKEDSDD